MRFVSSNLHSKFFKAAAFIFILSASSFVASAQVTQVSAKTETAAANVPDAQIDHLGISNGMLIFQVKVNNVDGKKFRVIVKDDDGTILFQDSYNDRNFAKKFVIPRPDSDRLVFIVKSSEGDKSESFEINSSTRIVEDVVVKRI